MLKHAFVWVPLWACSVLAAYGSLLDTVPRCCDDRQVLNVNSRQCQFTEQNDYNVTTDSENEIYRPANSFPLRCPNGLATFTITLDALVSDSVTVPGGNRTLSNGEMCIVNSASNVTTIAYCKAINKCCPPGQVLHSSLRKCAPAQGVPTYDRVTRDDGTSLSFAHNSSGHEYYLNFCFSQLRKSADGIEFDDYNGTIVTEALFNTTVNANYYCLDFLGEIANNEYKMVAMVGEPARKPHSKAFAMFFLFFPPLCFVSSGFLLLTIIFYLSITKLRQNLHGYAMVCFLLSVMIVQTDNGLAFGLAKRICVCTFIPYHKSFFRYASSAWTTVVGYMIWSQLKSVRVQPRAQENKKLTFAMYSLYGWGLPLVLTTAHITYDQFYPLTSPCWWKTQHVLLFMDVPNITLLLFNNIFFIPSAKHVCKSLRFIKNSLQSTEANALRKKRRMAVIKMFFMMQSTKLAELLFSIQSVFGIKNRVYVMTSMCLYSIVGPLLFFVLVDWATFFKTNLGARLHNSFQSTLRYSSSVASLFKPTESFTLDPSSATSEGPHVQPMRYARKQLSTASTFEQPTEKPKAIK